MLGAGAGLRHGEADEAGARDDLGGVPIRYLGCNERPRIRRRARAALEPRRNQRAILVARETHGDPAVGRAQQAAAPARGDRAAALEPEIGCALAEERRSIDPARVGARGFEREARLRRERAQRVERRRGADGERRGRKPRRLVRAPAELHRSRARPRERRMLAARRNGLGADRWERGEQAIGVGAGGVHGGRLLLASPGLDYDTPASRRRRMRRAGILHQQGLRECRSSRRRDALHESHDAARDGGRRRTASGSPCSTRATRSRYAELFAAAGRCGARAPGERRRAPRAARRHQPRRADRAVRARRGRACRSCRSTTGSPAPSSTRCSSASRRRSS